MTHKKLQKLCYYAYSWFIYMENDDIENIENRLFEEKFQAWVHGPVNYELYLKYSVSNIHKITEKLSHYDSIQCYLDNDDAGRNAYQQLAKRLGDSVSNCSMLYNGFKDFNEYLCAEIKQPEKAEVKRNKGLRL